MSSVFKTYGESIALGRNPIAIAGFAAEAHSCSGGFSSTTITINYKYSEGSFLYIFKEAERGIIERVFIKKVDLYNNAYGQIIAVYTDTLNCRWNEWELCSQQDAKAAAINYLQLRQAEIASLLGC